MNNRYFFTVNLLIRSEAHLQSAVHSIMEDEKFFLENVQIVLIDSIGNPESSSFCADLTARYPENVSFVETIGQNPPESYNTAKTISAGTYVSFIDNFSFYSSGTLKKIKRILSSGMIPLLSVAVPESLREPGLLPPLKGIVEPGKNPQWLQPLLAPVRSLPKTAFTGIRNTFFLFCRNAAPLSMRMRFLFRPSPLPPLSRTALSHAIRQLFTRRLFGSISFPFSSVPPPFRRSRRKCCG